jgi:DNA-binding MarR family transcriptional regulator
VQIPSEVAECLERLFERLMHVGEAEMMEALADQDLSFTQARVLFTLANGQPMAINELAAQLGQSMAAAGRNVDSLVRSGLVERNENPMDRRVRLVSVSAKGREVVDHHVRAHRHILKAFAEQLPEEQSERLLEALRPIVAGFTPACLSLMKTKEPHG